MDWVGIALFIAGGTLYVIPKTPLNSRLFNSFAFRELTGAKPHRTLTGCLLTTTIPSSDVRVVAPLTTGLVVMVIFGVWENQAEQRFNVQYPLCPRRVFTKGKGRDMTAPFLVVFVRGPLGYIFVHTDVP